MTIRAAAIASGLSDQTWKNVEQGRKVSDRTLALVERTLGWEPGSVDAILAGGDPTPAEPPGERSLAELAEQVAELRARLEVVERELLANLRGLMAHLEAVESEAGMDLERRARRARVSARAVAAASSRARRRAG